MSRSKGCPAVRMNFWKVSPPPYLWKHCCRFLGRHQRFRLLAPFYCQMYILNVKENFQHNFLEISNKSSVLAAVGFLKSNQWTIDYRVSNEFSFPKRLQKNWRLRRHPKFLFALCLNHHKQNSWTFFSPLHFAAKIRAVCNSRLAAMHMQSPTPLSWASACQPPHSHLSSSRP